MFEGLKHFVKTGIQIINYYHNNFILINHLDKLKYKKKAKKKKSIKL